MCQPCSRRERSFGSSIAAVRALILSWEYPPLIEGGLARHVRRLAEGLVETGVEAHVLTRGTELSPPYEQLAGVHVHRVREPERPSQLDHFLAWVAQMNADLLAAGVELGDEHSFDLVHGHDWLVAVAGDHLARRFRSPLLVTIHATEHGRHQGWVEHHPQSHIHGIERWMANRADGVVVCSRYMRRHVAEVFGIEQGPIEVIPNGVEPFEHVDPDALVALRRRYAADGERLVLLVGRLVYEKGFQLALAALPRLIERLEGVRFVVAGSGTHEAELRAQAARLGLERRGQFLGWVHDDLLRGLYRVADLAIVPSIYEPFGLVALEAMAAGCPCLAADTGGLREVVPQERAGLRFRARDPDALAEAAIRLLTDELLRGRVVAAAAAHVLRFDWSDVARRTALVYEALSLDPPNPAAPRGRIAVANHDSRLP